MGKENSPGLREYISPEEIEEIVGSLAREIAEDYKDEELLVVGVLKGATIFLSDLMKQLSNEGYDSFEIGFIEIDSYVGKKSTEDPKIKYLGVDVKGKNVLVVEDIVDTGYTFDKMLTELRSRGPASLKTCALLSKPAKREVEVPIDYLGREIDDVWVEGYGMDTDEKGRGYPFIGVREES